MLTFKVHTRWKAGREAAAERSCCFWKVWSGQEEAEVSVRRNLMIHKTNTPQTAPAFIQTYEYIWNIYLPTQPQVKWSGFSQGEAFGLFCPLSLRIFSEQQASLHRPKIVICYIAQNERELQGVLTWKDVFCHLSVDWPWLTANYCCRHVPQ